MKSTDILSAEKTKKIYLGLGSNLGSSFRYLRKGCRLLEQHLNFMQISTLYKTAPRDYTDQPDFINCAVCGYTALNPRQWLSIISDIEEECNRDRESQPAKGPRTLDVDILFWDGGSWDEPDLHVPHQSLLQRQFALIPLLELEPSLVHPLSGIPLQDSLNKLEDQGVSLYSRTIQ